MPGILGAVLAGGRSSRFGSDKALADFDGQTLLMRAVMVLSGWCDHVVVVGRAEAPAPTLPDWPRADMGPLGGIAAALHLACDQGYDEVLTCSVDALHLPEDLPALLSPAPSCLAGQPVIGLWPSAVSPVLDELLEGAGRHSMMRFAHAIGVRHIVLEREPDNVNTREDLERLRKHF